MKPVAIALELTKALSRLHFGPPVFCVYNPLEYAWAPYLKYLEEFGGGRKEALFIGMNPGPWGMAQTGIPFGEVRAVRDWMGISGLVGKPRCPHPKRPVEGFLCQRSEASGRRLWGWAQDKFGPARNFFQRFLVLNYCPLMFIGKQGENLTPDKLPRATRDEVIRCCDRAFRQLVEHYRPEYVIGIGNFAESRAREALQGLTVRIGKVLHPSPASPMANRDWAGQADRALQNLGIRY